MSEILAFFTDEGVIIGSAVEQLNTSYIVTNPVVVIPQDRTMSFIPILGMMEENTIQIYSNNYRYGKPFTPTVEIRNHYNKLFGSGIVEVTANPKGGLLLA